MYSVQEIKELLKAFDSSKASKLEIRNAEGEKFTLMQEKETSVVMTPTPAATLPVPVVPQIEVKAPTAIQQPSPFKQPEEVVPDDGSKPVASPMVGVFYASSSPDKDPYVSVGTKVKKGDVLCLIEAMKLMNEVTAEQSGEIVKICVENGQVVEFGQPLFMIK